MQHDDVALDYIIANGPEGLWDVLIDLLAKFQSQSSDEPAQYYIKYLLGQQKSLIKVDFHANPIHFWYYDLLGRPPTNGVRTVIAKFLWEKCGVKERFAITEGRVEL
jgi:hypothetical protein